MAKKRFQSLSISHKLTLPFLLVSLLLLCAIGAVVHIHIKQVVTDKVIEQVEYILDALVVTIESQNAHHDYNRAIGLFAAHENILNLDLVNLNNGLIIGSNHREYINKAYTATASNDHVELFNIATQSTQQREHFLLQQPYLLHGAMIHLIDPESLRLRPFFVNITYDMTQDFYFAYVESFLLLGIVLTGLFCLTLFQYLLQKKYITSRLFHIIQVLKQQKGTQEPLLIHDAHQDELSLLADAYNKLNLLRTQQSTALNDARQYIDQITYNAPVILAYVDEQYCYRFVNHTFEKWFNKAIPQVLNHNMQDVLSPDTFAQVKPYLQRVFNGETIQFDDTLQLNNPSLLHTRSIYTPDIDKDGTVRGCYICIENITEHKQTEDKLAAYAQELEFQTWALEDAKERAEEVTRTKSEFLACMSHEIRTPMNGVLGMLQVLQQEQLSDKQQHFIQTAYNSAEALLQVINDILDFSKIEAGKIDLEIIDFDIQALLKEIALIMQFKAEEQSILFALEIVAMPQPWVQGDPGRLRQILLNLLGNAIKFTRKGQVTLRVAQQVIDDDRLQFEFKVIDTGIGIAKDKLPTLFEAFTQADASTTRKFGGTGLGLSIVKQLCQIMQGDVSVSSTLGQGSEFCVKIPLAQGLPNDTLMHTTPLSGDQMRQFSGNILLVEDNAINQEVAFAILHGLGLEISVANNGLEAIEALQTIEHINPRYFDLILMDCQMPEMDGYETTQHIRQQLQPPLSELPIIAMTANAMKGDKEHCFRIGMNDYIAKPIQQEELIQLLYRWLPSSEA